MPSTSHRRCQYQGEGCTGTAHAGHDQCAHCYFKYVKPALQAERQDVKSRRSLKRRLSAANRQLISEVDLKEPQLRVSDSIRNAIYEIELDRLIENKTEEEAHDAVVAELQKNVMHDFGLTDPLPFPKRRSQPEPEEVPEPEPEPEPPAALTRHVHAGGNDSHLTEPQVAEVVAAYVDGMTVTAICTVLNIATTTLYAILRERGIALRGRSTRPAQALASVAARRLPPLRKDQSTMPVSPTPVEPTSANGRVSDLPEWVVTYTITRTETVTVAAKGFSDAATAARSTIAETTPGMDDVEVISVAKKRS